jgi:hypothetical protein
MTARKLRQALFNLSNQKMTVEELRAMLYEADDQDKEMPVSDNMWADLEDRWLETQRWLVTKGKQ